MRTADFLPRLRSIKAMKNEWGENKNALVGFHPHGRILNMTELKLIVVDDETDNLDALERIFRRRHQFYRANSGAEALNLLAQHPDMAVIVTDQRMPQMTGVELLEKTLHTHPQMVRILLTGYTEIDSIIAAVNQGHIFRYITKPWDSVDLINSVDQAMEHFSRGQALEIKNRELESALAELKKLDEAKSKFMILINHELKTPLTVISSFLQLMKESRLNEEQIIYWDRIFRSSQRLQEIIDDTFILTHSAAGTLKPKLQNISFMGLIEKAIEESRFDLEKKKITLINESPEAPPPPALYLDGPLISKALKHLLQNAIRFAPDESRVRWACQSSPGQLLFSIENPGAFISPEVLQKMDTPFNLQSDIMNHSKGLGMGLSVTNAILKTHRSRLNIENKNLPNGERVIRASFSFRF